MKRYDDSEEFDSRAQAFVDNELAHDERLEFLSRIEAEPRLAADVARLSALKSGLREAYPPASADARRAGEGKRRALVAVAASLCVGFVLGIALARVGGVPGTGAADLAATRSGVESTEVMTRVLLHVGSNEPAAMSEALASARYILEDFAESGRPVRVNIVANGPGLDIFRRGVSPFARRISELEHAYSNVQFVACQNTINRVEKETHEPVTLLPDVLRVDSGVADIARKRARGWLYIGV